MNLDNLYYSKQDSSKAIESEVVQANKPDEFAEIGGMGADDTDYTKGEPFIDTGIVFILSGGSEREKDYFRPLKIDKQIHNVKIAFRSKKGQGLKPYELASLASEFVSSKSFTTEDNISYHIEKGDIIYLIQDVDEFGLELTKQLKSDYDKSSIHWIISNPAFEIWLFYHYNDDTSLLKEGLSKSERDRSNWLKEYLNEIIPGGIKTTQAFHSVDIAIKNSRNNYIEKDGIPDVFSTQMHIVAEKIISMLGEAEFKAMNERRNNRIAAFKKQTEENPKRQNH
ncbi:MAG: RloB domain-containing protein [Muribaculaceae bacterium]|nr:RloB domain-containing protein [Muribaculaceae bacterium]